MAAQLDPIITKLGLDACDQIAPLKELCQKIKVPRPAYLVLGVLVISVFMIVLGLAQHLITTLLGMLYPAYKSIKAIETKNSSDDQQWLTYWIVFSLATVFDDTFSMILGFIPFYYLIKLIFYVFLFHPDTQGASKVFALVIKPCYDKYHVQIDEKLNMLDDKAKEQLNKIKQ